VLVKIDEPDDEYGMKVAAPVFSRLMAQILPYLGAMPAGPALVEAAPDED
jgi:hypothetical protein